MAMTRSAPSSQRALDGELPDRSAAPDRDGIARLDVAVLRGHVAGREDVGEERTCSSEMPAGTLSGPTSANGTRTYSACPPA